MSDTTNKIQLELHVPSFAVAQDFYQKLGFAVVWSREKGDSGDYMVMEHSGTILNFWPGNEHVYEQPYFKQFPKDTKRGYGIEIVYAVDDIDSYYDTVRLFANVVEELHMQPWGSRDFRFEDPFGYYFRVTEPHDITDNKNQVV